MPRQITEKLREQRRLATARFREKKKKQGYGRKERWFIIRDQEENKNTNEEIKI